MTKTFGGRYYGITRFGQMIELQESDPGVPDAVICRRLRDFKGEQIPEGAAISGCQTCGCAIVFNPKGRHLDRPRRCMQCAGIRPLPIE
jgi:hypothetical protein